MKNIKSFAMVGTLALTLAACGNNAKTEAPADKSAEKPATEVTDDAKKDDTKDASKDQTAAGKTGEATVAGYGGDMTVKVTIGADGNIEAVETVSHEETEDIGAKALPDLEDAVVGKNSAKDVENVSGATVTSEAFKKAVDEAIANAK